MKLRILDNSLRLRLSQTEVTQLRDRGEVRARIQFPGQTALDYRVLHQENTMAMAAAFRDHEITLSIPTARILAWADSDIVSIEADNKLPNGQSLRILLEKDFKCLTTRAHEDESDLFPHPKEGTVEC